MMRGILHRSRFGRAIVAVLATVLLVTASASFVGGAAAETQSEPVVRVGDTAIEPGGTATVPVALSAAPDGLAGYDLTSTVADGQVATIVGVNYSADTPLTTTPSVDDGGTQARLRAVDLERSIEPGASNVTLARLRLRGVSPGETTLSIDVSVMDDDDGNPVSPVTDGSRLTVRSDGDSAAIDPEQSTEPDGDPGLWTDDRVPVENWIVVLLGAVVAALGVGAFWGYRRR